MPEHARRRPGRAGRGGGTQTASIEQIADPDPGHQAAHPPLLPPQGQEAFGKTGGDAGEILRGAEGGAAAAKPEGEAVRALGDESDVGAVRRQGQGASVIDEKTEFPRQGAKGAIGSQPLVERG